MAFNAGAIEATLDLDRSPYRRGLEAAKKDAETFERKKIKAKLDIEVDSDQLESAVQSVNKAAAKTKKAKLKVDPEMDLAEFQKKYGHEPITIDVGVDGKAIEEKLDRIGDQTELTAKRSGNRIARALLNPLVIQLGLIPGLAAASALASGVALGAIPVAMGALAGLLFKDNELIKASYKQTWEDVKTGAKTAAKGMEDTLLRVSIILRKGFSDIKPTLNDLFDRAGPGVEGFSKGLVALVTNMLPGFNAAMKNSTEIGKGWENLLGRLGSGVSDLFIGLSRYAGSTGVAMDQAGRTIQILLGFVGELVGKFSQFWASVGSGFNDSLQKLLTTVLNFADKALPMMGAGLKILLALLDGILGVLGPLSGSLGTVAGAVLSGVAVWKLLAGAIGLATKAASLFSGAKLAAGLSNMAGSVGVMTTKMTGSATAGEKAAGTASKWGKALSGVGVALPIVGAALLAFGLGMGAVEEHQRAMTEKAEGLAKSLLMGGTAARQAKRDMELLGDFDTLAKKFTFNPLEAWAAKTNEFKTTLDRVNPAYQELLKNTSAVELAQMKAKQAQLDYDNAVRDGGAGTLAAKNAAAILATRNRELAEAQHQASQATKDHTQKIQEQQLAMLTAAGAGLSYEQSLLGIERAEKNAIEAVKEHGKGSLEAREAQLAYEQSILTAIDAIGRKTAADYASSSEAVRSTAVQKAQAEEIMRLALIAGTHAPASLRRLVAGLDGATLSAMGVKISVDKAGNAVYNLNGKTITISAEDRTAGVIQRIKQAVAAIQNATVVFGAIGAGIGGRAGGGPIEANRPYWVGEEGPELIFPSKPAYVATATQSATLFNRSMPGRQSSLPDQDDLSEAMLQVLAQIRDYLSGLNLEVSSERLSLATERANSRRAAH